MSLSLYVIFLGENSKMVCILACKTTDQHKGAYSCIGDSGASKEDLM